jgi:hypothetical protein
VMGLILGDGAWLVGGMIFGESCWEHIKMYLHMCIERNDNHIWNKIVSDADIYL